MAGIGAAWPVLFGGQAHWTVGLVATLISMSSIIAADTYAFLGGKVFRLHRSLKRPLVSQWPVIILPVVVKFIILSFKYIFLFCFQKIF